MRKAVTTLAIAPETESITRTARLAYNVMIFKAQRSNADEDGGYTAPLSEILKGFDGTTRDSTRVRGYIEQMCTTLVRWFPLSPSDEAQAQATIDGVEPSKDPNGEVVRVFTLLSEAQFSRRAGEWWLTYYFPPTIRQMIIEPTRWAELDIKEMAALSHYTGLALYEICGRYKDVPGGLTNRADPSWWVQALRQDPDTKPREWRKFKNESLKPALAELRARTSLDVELIEYKRGRAVVEVQFRVRRRAAEIEISPVDVTLVTQALRFGIKERDFDLVVDEYGEVEVRKAFAAMLGRERTQPNAPINSPLAYLRMTLRNATSAGPLFDQPAEPKQLPPPRATVATEAGEAGLLASRTREVAQRADDLPEEEIARLAGIARERLRMSGILSPNLQKRLDGKQYRSPLIWVHIKEALAVEMYGAGWKSE